MTERILKYIESNKEACLQTLRELCRIPAPSHHEEKRAAYCLEFFKKIGAEGAYIDEALNVVFPFCCEGSRDILAVCAHTDTVFPDTEPLPYEEDDEYIRCPGVGDDTWELAVLLYAAKFFVENKIAPRGGILFICNSCEEGLGNLKGTKQIFADYEGRISRFISYDSSMTAIADQCVGSHRYKVEVTTCGGHSYGAFGNPNAIHELSRIVSAIYDLELPQAEGAKTTYNVGNISGGTSVNTIAQSAEMLCEYRSNNADCLAYMQKKFEEIFQNAQSDRASVKVTVIGKRPCGIAKKEEVDALKAIAQRIMEEVTGEEIVCRPSSTDCNIPLSLGIPAICIGTKISGGTHTREEWAKKSVMPLGLQIGIRALYETACSDVCRR